MEIGSVLELDDIGLYRIPQNDIRFILPFMGDKSDRYETVFYQSGRNAIEILMLFLKEKSNISEVYLPDYVCASVKDAVLRAGLKVTEYRVNRDYQTDIGFIEANISDNACFFTAHYFGQKMSADVVKLAKELGKRNIVTVEDITMSLLSKDEGYVGFGDYIIGSIRKWLPIPDGGFISSNTKELPEPVTEKKVSRYTDYYMAVQMMKRKYVDGGYKDKELKEIYMGYYSLSIDELFSDYSFYPMSEWSRAYIANVNLDEVIQKRKHNLSYLSKLLSKIGPIRIKVKYEDGYLPLGLVIEADDREELIKYLISNDVYCNVHWRLNSEANEDVTYLGEHSITIPCDQRYSDKEMKRVADLIAAWYKDR